VPQPPPARAASCRRPAATSPREDRRRAPAVGLARPSAKDAPSKTTSSCPPTRWRIQQRQPGVARALGHARFALAGLVQVEGRSVEHAAGTCGAGVAARPGPARQTRRPRRSNTPNRSALHLEHQRRQAGVAAGGEVAAARRTPGSWAARACSRCPAPPVGQHRGRVAAALHGVRLGPNIAGLAELCGCPPPDADPPDPPAQRASATHGAASQACMKAGRSSRSSGG
jgi:hypothetical protein